MQLTSIDLSTLPADLAATVLATIGEHEAKTREVREWQEVLDHGTEEEIIEKTARECRKGTPLVAAHCYGDGFIPAMREVTPLGFRSHPRRAVVARGAKLVVYNKYSLSPNNVAPNGWNLRLHERAVRMSKKTLIYRDEILNFIESLAIKSGAPWDYTVRSFAHDHRDNNVVLMSGKWVNLTDAEYRNVKMFYDIIRKTDKVEERLALLREARKEQSYGVNAREKSQRKNS
jgi:hypothetical protein